MCDIKFIGDNIKNFFLQFKLIFKFKKKYKKHSIKQILVAGGYGYGNVGDEAQCSETIKVLKKNFSDFQIKVLTPDPNYSFKEHNHFSDYASRVLFFNQRRDFNCYDFDNSISRKA